MLAQNAAQRIVQEVGGGVIAGDVRAPFGVHHGLSTVAHLGPSASLKIWRWEHLPHVDDEAWERLSNVADCDLPLPRLEIGDWRLEEGFDDHAGITDLAAALHIEGSRS